MKNGKRPTRKQKLAMKAVRLNPENWLVTKNLPGELHLVHRETNRERKLPV
ncbi:DUF6906 family protein [Aneurinibacillus migulanus]|uniref:DUF6906 family protein n=1 Tax=Aneurinibacillus migulanus TaxID=47500 RepID=UPI000A5EB8E4|nr:hypothetical protein [Aneurinibacillus migulanus]MCP1355437.1 hypothetical protein [Aneurinibacillus migulanus]MED0895265.1 hypothetical protein [Aneurinibacillus migulanus]MED1616176.1 hypothetical protein [Aneurinibacillus migulanus]